MDKLASRIPRLLLVHQYLLDITLAPKKLIRTRRASEGSASEPSLARRVSMCKDAKLSCRGNILRHPAVAVLAVSELLAAVAMPVLHGREKGKGKRDVTE